MQKKLQIFISSTFTDLIEERQAAVEAILNSGHIPAGMELFKSGDSSQKETIKRWIEESDAYMLILGGRYGSIEEESGKSYTHWEYDYAGEIGKPRFAVVIKDSYLDEKVKDHGKEVLETKNPHKYQEFKADVLSKISKFYSDIKDIKLTVLESLKEFERDEKLNGWVSGKEIGSLQELLNSNFKLLEENQKLSKEIESLRKGQKRENEINGHSFEEVLKYLRTVEIELPTFSFDESLAGKTYTLLRIFLSFKNYFSIGIENRADMSEEKEFLFFNVSPRLIAFGLLEKVKVAGTSYQRIQLSKDGNKFISIYELMRVEKTRMKVEK